MSAVMKGALVTLALLVTTGPAGQVVAQGHETRGNTAEAKPSRDQGNPRQTIQGKIAEVDEAGTRLTLADGTVLVLSGDLKVSRDSLKKGALVQARYEEKGGQKIVRGITVQPRD